MGDRRARASASRAPRPRRSLPIGDAAIPQNLAHRTSFSREPRLGLPSGRSMSPIDGASVARVVLGLDRWFDAMRATWPTPGYGGPVVHWWNHCLAYRGAGLDWRYEGIVDGYLTLWRRTGDRRWLVKAMRAGDDLVEGQLANGCFRNSMFELNPGDGGTPHEAAADIGLLLLARALREIGDPCADRYQTAAERNI